MAEADKNDALEAGMKTRREVLGDAHVDRAELNSTSFDAEFQEFLTRYAWGDAWQRGTLDRRVRHLVTLSVLCALGREHELELHLRATVNTGVSQDDVKEAFHQVAVYAGVPAANTGFAIAKRVFAESD
jgi:4-carboxymuconolactone decarboxylase